MKYFILMTRSNRLDLVPIARPRRFTIPTVNAICIMLVDLMVVTDTESILLDATTIMIIMEDIILISTLVVVERVTLIVNLVIVTDMPTQAAVTRSYSITNSSIRRTLDCEFQDLREHSKCSTEY